MATVNELHHTQNGTPYFTEPGISLVSYTLAEYANEDTYRFLTQHDEGWAEYLDEPIDVPEYQDEHDLFVHTRPLTSAELLTKFSGQIDYLSFGPRRTMNKDAQGYITRAKQQRHGNLFEQADFAFLIWGVSRSLTHELVRHRMFSLSQTSQRYVDRVRFVERPEYQLVDTLHRAFEWRIDEINTTYSELISELVLLAQDDDVSATERRKAVRQQARSLLPNETETSLIVKGNARTWRNFLEKRARPEAEPEIRKLALCIYGRLVQEAPYLFDDYEVMHQVSADGQNTVIYLHTDYEGV